MSLCTTVVHELAHPPGGRGERAALLRGRAVAALAGRQHGVVARRQLVEIGLGRGSIGWWLRSGRLRRIHSGVYMLGAGNLDRYGRWLAAALAYGDSAVLSHASAAALWGLRRNPRTVDVTSDRGRAGRSGIRLHRSRIAPDETTRRNRIPVTTVGRVLLDLADALDADDLRGCWEEADRLGLLRLDEIALVCERAAGRRGVTRLTEFLSEARLPSSTRSPLEDRFVHFCVERKVPMPVTNALVLGHEVDALWPEQRLIVELDGFAFHGHRSAFERDRARDFSLAVAGYRVVRLTHRRLDREPMEVAAELRRLLPGG